MVVFAAMRYSRCVTPGRLDGPDLLELHLRVPEVVEEAGPVAEQHWNKVELEPSSSPAATYC